MTTFLTISELAEELKVSRRWIHEQIRTGDLPHHYLGSSRRVLRFRLSEVLEWVEAASSNDSVSQGQAPRRSRAGAASGSHHG